MTLAALNATNSEADTARQGEPALVGNWKAEGRDSRVLTFSNDGRWAQRDGDRVDSWGAYRWRDKDLIELGAMEDGQMGPTALWRVALNGDALATWDASNNVAKWSRVKTSSQPTQQHEPVPSRSPRYTVKLVGAVIGLTKTDGRSWDPGGTISQEDLTRFRNAAWKLTAKGVAGGDSVTAAAGIAGVIGAAVVAKKAIPDPMGTAELSIDGERVGQVFSLPYTKDNQDTFTPAWSPGRWRHISLDAKHDVRLYVNLQDYDWADGNDPMLPVEISRKDLLDAARFGKVFPVYVGDQSENQVMFLKISVTMESSEQ